MAKLSKEERQQLIDHLVGNCDCGMTPVFNAEQDIETLSKMDDDALIFFRDQGVFNEDDQDEDDDEDDDVMDNMEEEDMEDEEDDEEEMPPMMKKKGKKPVKNQFNESDLPADIREDLAFARNMKQQQKDQHIAKITANGNCAFTVNELNAKSLDELQKLASLVSNSAPTKRVNPRVGGNCRGAVNNSNPSKVEDGEVLDLPVMNWEENA